MLPHSQITKAGPAFAEVLRHGGDQDTGNGPTGCKKRVRFLTEIWEDKVSEMAKSG